MEDRRTISDILKASGRIEEEDVQRALTYQRKHGGYLGEALVALGLVSPEEVEWSLASQIDVPYVFPDAESVDEEVVRLVRPEWALANLTVPIMRSGDQLTVVVDQPDRRAAAKELGKRLDCEISLALASPSRIRRLIREVFTRRVEGVERPDPTTLADALGVAVAAGTERFGISTRGPRALFWFDDEESVRRIPLLPGWIEELDGISAPAVGERIEGSGRTAFDTELDLRGIEFPVGVHFLADASGREYLFLPRKPREVGRRFEPPPLALVSEVRMLSGEGTARFALTTEPDALGRDLLPRLPQLIFGSRWRSIYVHRQGRAARTHAFSLGMPTDEELWSNELATLGDFAFDVATVDLGDRIGPWASRSLDVAPVTFLAWPDGIDLRAAHDAGIRWQLHVADPPGAELEWTLRPLRT